MNQLKSRGNNDHIALINKAVEMQDPSIWNQWKANEREKDNYMRPNLDGIDLSNEVLHGFDFQFTDLNYADLSNCKMSTRFDYANLNHANLDGAFLCKSIFWETQINHATISNCDFEGSRIEASNFDDCDLQRSKFYKCNLEDSHFKNCKLAYANFQDAYLLHTSFEYSHFYYTSFWNANLKYSNFANTEIYYTDFRSAILNHINFSSAIIKHCNIYGTAAWDLQLDNTTQLDNNIQNKQLGSNEDETDTKISVDEIEVAQFIYLIMNNQKITQVVNTTTSKIVLILGRFYEKRKEVLDALRDHLRKNNLAPIVFDFEPSKNRDLTETVQWLANMSKFVIADITDAKSIPQELSHIIPFFPSVPVIPILLENEKEYPMNEHWKKYNSVLPIFYYKNKDHLLNNIELAVLKPVEDWKKKKKENLEKDKKIEEQKKIIEEQEKEIAELRKKLAN